MFAMNIRWLIAALFVCALTGVRGEDDMPANQEAKLFRSKLAQEVELRYLLFLPEGYKEDASKHWPLMLFLHGAGERGTNLAKVAVHGPPKVVKGRKDFPFILVSPQCPSNQTWSDEALLKLLDEVQERYRVDTNRVYLTGLSMGGYGTWSLGLKNPDRFAAIGPICGGGSILPILLPATGKQSPLKRLPVWAFHGAKDPVVPLQQSEALIEALKHAGNHNVKLTVYPEAGHDSWTEAYDNQELYEWFLQQTREKKTSKRNTLRAKHSLAEG
jgi:predicted peptidase